METKDKNTVKTKNIIPEWKPSEDLSTICEPIYRMACLAVKDCEIEDKEKMTGIWSKLGCDSFVPTGKNLTRNNGKEYPGKMPKNFMHPITYAATCNTEGKINYTILVNNDGTTNNPTLTSCGGMKECFLSKHSHYCYNYIIKYIKYLRTYYPEEEKKQRKKYARNPYPAYKKLEDFQFEISDLDLQEIPVTTETLRLGKMMIDKGLILPTVAFTENNKVHIIIYYPEYVKELFVNDKLTLKNYKTELLKTEKENTFRDTLAELRSDMEFPYNSKSIKQFFQDAFSGKEEHQTYFIATILFCYTTLQKGQYEKLLKEKSKKENSNLETAKTIIGEDENKILQQKNGFFGILVNEGHDNVKTVTEYISSTLRKGNPDMQPGINHITITEFIESFSERTNIYGENHDFNLKITQRPKKNILYVLDNLEEIFISAKKTKHSDNNRSRVCRKAFSFLESYLKDYYILISCSEKEKEKFLELDKTFPYTFGKNIIKIPDETAETALKKIRDMGNEKTKEQDFKQYFEENANKAPFKNDTFLRYLDHHIKSYHTLPDNFQKKDEDYNEKTLNNIVGLEEIKKQLKKLENYITFSVKAQKQGIKLPFINRHMLFKGNPGTGKTTIARAVAKILYNAGVTNNDKLVECKASDLVGEYVGQTSPKTEAKIEEAYDGVLFIDEAYAIQYAHRFGNEVIASLVKEMEDNKEKLTVILAGYTKEMENFIASNPGLASRIGYTFDFPDYTEEELLMIYQNKMKEYGFKTEPEALEKIKKSISINIQKENFGNGRFIDKLIQEILMEHAQNMPDETINTITGQDIPEEENMHVYKEKVNPKIGFQPT